MIRSLEFDNYSSCVDSGATFFWLDNVLHLLYSVTLIVDIYNP